jgi:predicted Co/Zn/Cd cation transporter (cation efflux family)
VTKRYYLVRCVACVCTCLAPLLLPCAKHALLKTGITFITLLLQFCFCFLFAAKNQKQKSSHIYIYIYQWKMIAYFHFTLIPVFVAVIVSHQLREKKKIVQPFHEIILAS